MGPNGESAFIATAFAQEDAEAAKAQWRKVADQLRPKLPKLAAFMDDAEADVLAYMLAVYFDGLPKMRIWAMALGR